MVVSRTDELRRLEALLAALVEGHGGALVVHGEAGIGKTTLLDALIERARDRVEVLRAGGVESEAELSFCTLADLLPPLVGGLDALPAPQRAALEAALALGPPAPGERLAVCVATLGLLRAAAQRHPVLVIVDDVQWVDAASRECIEYVARRADGPLAVVLAARDPWDASGLPALTVGPLDGPAAAELLGRVAPGL